MVLIAIIAACGLLLPAVGRVVSAGARYPLSLDVGSAIVRLALLALAAIAVVARVLLLQGQLLCTGQN